MKAKMEGASKQKQKLFLFVRSLTVHNYPQIIAARKWSLQTLLPLFKPNLLLILGVPLPQHPSDNPHRIQFDSDSQKNPLRFWCFSSYVGSAQGFHFLSCPHQ